ncbi:hypothetical protein SFRURICE_002148 [Spodoptera frugiperda]|nr:hypothetical protein SFRURICE_002148 [Spodoptera frugiperda]
MPSSSSVARLSTTRLPKYSKLAYSLGLKIGDWAGTFLQLTLQCSCKTNVGGIPVLRLSPTGNPIPGCGCAGGSRRKLGKRAHPLPPPAPQNLAPRALAARFRPPPPGPLTSLSPAKIAANRSVYAVHSVWPPSIHKKARRGRHVARRREGGLSRRPAPAADASAECAIERNGRFVGA